MQNFLFKKGNVPFCPLNNKKAIQSILTGNQSIHLTTIVKGTNCLTKKLIESTSTTEQELRQAADKYLENMDKLAEVLSDPMKIKLLGLTINEKKSITETVDLLDTVIENDREFIQIIIRKIKN